MDDVSILTGPIEAAKEALARTDTAVKWGGMALKPPKSRGLVMIGDRVIKCEPFKVDKKVIPGLHNNPLRTLGRTYEVDEKTRIISKVRRKEVKVKLEK